MKAASSPRLHRPDDEAPPGSDDPTNDPPEARAAAAVYPRSEDPPTAEQQRAAQRPRFEFIPSGAFAGGDYRPEWLITRALVRGQPGVIAGPSKALKTNLSIDLAVSLAAGVPFLGKFDVPARARVAVVSGESGAHTLQETAHRVCRAKDIDLAALDGYLDWCFELPTFSDLGVMDEFAGELAKLAAQVVIIDPLYLSLGAIDAKNLFEAGAAFRIVAKVLLDVGCTPLLVHHANRQLVTGEPMELTHLSHSGVEQFARQWMLLNRREKFKGDGTHDLWLTLGGSVGTAGLWNLHVEEGTIDENFAGRRWDVDVRSRSEAEGDAVVARQEAKREAARVKEEAERQSLLLALDAEVAKCGAATRTRLKERTGYRPEKVSTLLNDLADVVVEVEFRKTSGNGASVPTKGYKRREPDAE